MSVDRIAFLLPLFLEIAYDKKGAPTLFYDSVYGRG